MVIEMIKVNYGRTIETLASNDWTIAQNLIKKGADY